jgi:hypothetical protein
MASKKVKKDQPLRVEVLVPVEPNRIYWYKRDWKLLNPIPYSWKPNWEKIKEKIKA